MLYIHRNKIHDAGSMPSTFLMLHKLCLRETSLVCTVN